MLEVKIVTDLKYFVPGKLSVYLNPLDLLNDLRPFVEPVGEPVVPAVVRASAPRPASYKKRKRSIFKSIRKG